MINTILIILGIYIIVGAFVLAYAIRQDARILWSLTACLLIVLFYPYFLIKHTKQP